MDWIERRKYYLFIEFIINLINSNHPIFIGRLNKSFINPFLVEDVNFSFNVNLNFQKNLKDEGIIYKIPINSSINGLIFLDLKEFKFFMVNPGILFCKNNLKFILIII